MRQGFFSYFLVIFLFCSLAISSSATQMETLTAEMISAYSASSKGVQDEAFLGKVAEIDEHMRTMVERDHNLAPFRKLIKTAQKFSARKSARKMFEIVLEKAFKRLQFTRVQQDFEVSAEMSEEIDQMITSIEKYLDPSIPDLDTVDRNSLENQRKRLERKLKKANNKVLSEDEDKRIKVEMTDEEGNSSQMSPSREANLLAKLNTVVPDPGKMTVKIKATHDDMFDMEIFVWSFVAPNGFSVVQGELGFSDIAFESLDDNNASEVDNVLGDSHFQRYRIVQNEEQLNVMPRVGESAYEMGSLAPGQKWKMPFKKVTGISSIIEELEGNEEIIVVNAKRAKADSEIEFKNNGTKNLIFLQGTDMTGLVSVKALGFLIPKKGQVTFREALMVVDDELSSSITSYIGGQGINWFLKKASDNLRKGLPFTPILENINMDRDESGKMVYIFSGRGRVAR